MDTRTGNYQNTLAKRLPNNQISLTERLIMLLKISLKIKATVISKLSHTTAQLKGTPFKPLHKGRKLVTIVFSKLARR